MYYPSSENKGADQLRGYREADLRLCFRLCRLLVFPWGGSYDHMLHMALENRHPFSSVYKTLSGEVKWHGQSCFLCLYRPVCVGPVRKPHCWFSHEAAHLFAVKILCPELDWDLGNASGRSSTLWRTSHVYHVKQGKLPSRHMTSF